MPPSDPFPPTPLFPFPLFSSVIAGFEEHRQPLLDGILELRRQHPGITRSNRNAWHSGDEFLHNRDPDVAWLLQKILKFARYTLGRYNDGWSGADLVLASAWANVLGPAGWNAPHHHFPCHWSGVYYVSVGQGGSQRDDPASMIEFLNPTPGLAAIGQSGNFLHAPKDGLILLFPASLYHFVHPHATDDLRVSIAFNLNVSPKTAP